MSLVVAMIVVALAIAHIRVLAGGDTWRDVTYHADVAPPRLAAADAIASGSLPAWWDGTALGVPLAGEASHGALAPAIWLARSPRALDWVMLANLLWVALGVALLARKTASELGAVVAGILVGASGLLVATALRGALPAIAHLPWLALAAMNVASAPDRKRAAGWAIGVGAALGMIGLAGQLAVLVDALALATVLGARRATWPWLGAGIAAGLAIACAQWLPAIAAVGTTAGGTVGGLSLARLVELIVPVAAHAGREVAWPSLFVGAPLLALAVVTPASRRRIGLAIGLGVLALIAGRGGWPAITGAPELHAAALAIVIAPQVAAGLDALVAGERRARLALVIGGACSLVALVAVLVRDPEAARAGTLVDGSLGILCIAGALTIAWRGRPTGDAPTAAHAIVAVLLVAPSVGALGAIAPMTDRATVAEPSRWAELAASAAPFPRRLYRPAFMMQQGHSAAERTLSFDDQIATLVDNVGARFAIASARSEDPGRPTEIDRVFQASASEGGALLDRYGIALWIVPVTIVGPRKLPELARRGTWALVAAPVAPPAAVVRGAVFARDPAGAIALLFPSGGGMGVPRGTIAIAGTGDTRVEMTPPVPCAIDAWDPGELALHCTGAGYAVVSSSEFPGWTVDVDGVAATPLVADVIRRAVAVGPGAHAIRWHYRAPGLALGLGVAGAGLVVLLGLGVLSRPRRARRASRATTASPAS